LEVVKAGDVVEAKYVYRGNTVRLCGTTEVEEIPKRKFYYSEKQSRLASPFTEYVSLTFNGHPITESTDCCEEKPAGSFDDYVYLGCGHLDASSEPVSVAFTHIPHDALEDLGPHDDTNNHGADETEDA
jgi:hypothetical protein